MQPDNQIALALLGVALRPERQTVSQVARRLGWTEDQLATVVQGHQAALAVAGMQLHPARPAETSGRADGCILVDGTPYNGLSWPVLGYGYPAAVHLTRVLALVETWVAQLDRAGVPLPPERIMQLRGGVIWAATVGSAAASQPAVLGWEDPAVTRQD
jgi:hypothetical protein